MLILLKMNTENCQFKGLAAGKVSWTSQEDKLLIQAVNKEGVGCWNAVAKQFFSKSNQVYFKSPKHCRERWLNHLDDKKKHGNWVAEEDMTIFRYVSEYGKKWCKLVPILQDTRTEHMIKNRFNSLMRKQRRSKKDKDDHVIQRVMRLLKKQIANSQKRKLKRSFLEQQKSIHSVSIKIEQIQQQVLYPSFEENNNPVIEQDYLTLIQNKSLTLQRQKPKTISSESVQLQQASQSPQIKTESSQSNQYTYYKIDINYPYSCNNYSYYPYSYVQPIMPYSYYWAQ